MKAHVGVRRIMLICGTAADMSAVFRALLTGIVFALEMPYKDKFEHEALMPSLIPSAVSLMSFGSFLGSVPLFDFASKASFTPRDLLWCALLGLMIGASALIFNFTFRCVRRYCVRLAWPHWCKMCLGGLPTGLCGLFFLHL